MIGYPFELPYELRGKRINSEKIIPTVYNLKNMLNSLKNNDGDFSKLKQWEQRSYKYYNIEKIHSILLKSPYEEQINIIREHILNSTFEKLGASPFDIYIVAYVSDTIN